MLADYHVHSMFSDDSWYMPEQVAADAWKLNLDEICFTDHVDYGIKPDWDDALAAKVMDGQRVLNVDYAAYFPSIAEVREHWVDRIAIKCGLEFGVQSHTIPRYNALWDAWGSQLDFTLLSIHQVGDLEFWTGDFQRGREKRECAHAYYQELYDVATSFDHWSVMAHLDLIRRHELGHPFEFPENRELVAATLEYAIKQGKGIELNTSSVRYGMDDLHPARDVFELYRDLGGTIITLGSDSHKPEHLGAYLRHFQHALADIGFEGFCTFDKMVPTLHRWDFA